MQGRQLRRRRQVQKDPDATFRARVGGLNAPTVGPPSFDGSTGVASLKHQSQAHSSLLLSLPCMPSNTDRCLDASVHSTFVKSRQML
jgi:hypothetical protein